MQDSEIWLTRWQSAGLLDDASAAAIRAYEALHEKHPHCQFGTKITDNYRWLEDAKSSETRAFIDEENVYTTRYLKLDPIRNQALHRL